ncbi:unnamed protein product, partial [marine sediment metagenome]
GGDEWLIYGGHRFWHAPEEAPRSYCPDNGPVEAVLSGSTLKITQPTEPETGIAKEIEISLHQDQGGATVVHRLTNNNLWEITAAPWALTVMAQGGTAIFPQEPYRPHPEYLLPARPLVLWHYTDMSDPRFAWGAKYIQLRQDPTATTKNKIGMRNAQGWAAYCLAGDVFMKRFPVVEGATYPDFGCNSEAYTDADMLEIESLGPLAPIAPGGSVEHTEKWFLFKGEIGESEADIEKDLLPLVKRTAS